MNARESRQGKLRLGVGALAENGRTAKDTFRLLANENRLKILCSLLEGEKSVSEIMKLADLRQSTVSQQLALLRAHELVHTRRAGKAAYYKLTSFRTRAVLEFLGDLLEQESRVPNFRDDTHRPGLEELLLFFREFPVRSSRNHNVDL